MISDSRAEQALRYLASTDETCAAAKADCERAEFKAKALKNAVFLHTEGTVAERNAIAEGNAEVMAAYMAYFEAIKVYSAMANKRETERIVMDTWRTICANRRMAA